MNDKFDLDFTAEDRIAWWFVKAVVKQYLRVNERTLTDQEVDDCAENGYHLANIYVTNTSRSSQLRK